MNESRPSNNKSARASLGRRIAVFTVPIVVVLVLRPWCARAAGDRIASRLSQSLAVPNALVVRDAGAFTNDGDPTADPGFDPQFEPGDGVRSPDARRPMSAPWRGRGTSGTLTAEIQAGDGGVRKAPKSIFVPGRAVLQIVRSKRVSTRPVNDEHGAPLGIALHGVRGTGLQDGDVVTHIAGTRITTEEAAIAVIVGALANHAKTVSGTVLRNGQPIRVTVEVPNEAQVNATSR